MLELNELKKLINSMNRIEKKTRKAGELREINHQLGNAIEAAYELKWQLEENDEAMVPENGGD